MSEKLSTTRLRSYKIAGVAMTVILGLSLILGLQWGEVCAVKVDGKVVAYAETEKDAQSAVKTLTMKKSEELGQKITPGNNVEFETVKNSGDPLVKQKLIDVLAKKMDFTTEGVVIMIDGKPEFRFKDRNLAEEFLNQLNNKYVKGKDYKISYAEKVKIVENKVNVENLDTIDRAIQLAENGRGEPQIHKVQKGDTLWDLAVHYRTKVKRLKELNPAVTENLQLGQEIKVSGSAPLLTVKTSYKTTEEDAIPFRTQYRYDSSMPMGTRKTIQQGEEGLKKVTYKIVATNGIVTKKEVLSEEIIKEAVPRITKKGTKLILASRGSGLVWPVSGRISSYFGSRYGGWHRGIDIACSYGTSVRAAGPGRVTQAGWGGGYGKTITISHGNGIVTRYAHLSSIAVNRGQTVDRGQFIGRAGSSGNSTGPHLHFEILINGAFRNPLKYL